MSNAEPFPFRSNPALREPTNEMQEKNIEPTRGDQMQRGSETDLPEGDNYKVVTWLQQPIRHPMGCPRITKEMLAVDGCVDEDDDIVLQDGRACLIHGMMECTIPRNQTKMHFSSYHLGSPYSLEGAMEEDLPDLVSSDAETGIVPPEDRAVNGGDIE